MSENKRTVKTYSIDEFIGIRAISRMKEFVLRKKTDTSKKYTLSKWAEIMKNLNL